MRLLAVISFACAALMVTVAPAAADILITINKGTQRMSVAEDGRVLYQWRVSTGVRGHGTPSGVFHPQWMARSWFSRKYYNAPMPHAIFFHKGYAIHGTYNISRLGGPASHGCVRLYPANAAILYSLVQHEGMANTRIVVQ
jgi:lipoprotein-anchoring transpeptidase ErfK/SrfK